MDQISSNFQPETKIQEIQDFIISKLVENKYPKYHYEEIQILTTYPTRTFTYKDGNSTLLELNLDQKRVQLMIKVVKDVSKVEITLISDKIPGEIMCPISKNILIYPYVTKCGHIYEKKEIETWIQIKATCPNCDKPIYGPEELKEAPKDFRDKIAKYVEESTILKDEFKLKYKMKMKEIKFEKMNLAKLKGVSHKILCLNNNNYNQALNVWKEKGMPFWMIETEKNKYQSLSIFITIEIIQVMEEKKKKVFMISSKLLNIPHDIYLDFTKGKSYHSQTGKTRKIIKFEYSKDVPLYERSNNNTWVQLSIYSSMIIYSGIQLGCEFVNDLDLESVYNLKFMKMNKDKSYDIRKSNNEIKQQINQVRWQYQVVNDWYNYEVSNNKIIETVFNLKGKEANITKKDGKFKLVFKDMVEINSITQEKRKIQRIPFSSNNIIQVNQK